MLLIFCLSSIPRVALPQMPTDTVDFVAHKFAHLVEYTMLGLLWARAWVKSGGTIKFRTILFLMCWVLVYAAFDEWHQTFVPGRHGRGVDVFFDTIYGTIGILLYRRTLKVFAR